MKKLYKKPTILVIGDLMIDHYLWGSCDRISPEAPVQIVNVKKESLVLGGAGNVINNLRTMNSNVDVISVIGKDDVANELKTLLNQIEVSSEMLIVENSRKTSKKSRLIASQQQVLRYDMESVEDISQNSEKEISNKWTLSENYANYSYDAIIEIVDERVYEFNSHLEVFGTSLNDLTLEKSLDMEM